MGVVPDHRSEHHLVISALRAAQSAAHPGLEKDGAAFSPPAGRREARRGEVAVDDRFGVLRLGGDFAEEESPPAQVLLGSNVALHHVDQLVVHQRIHPLARGVRLERKGKRRSVEKQGAARRRVGVRVAVIGQILKQDDRWLGRRPAEYATLPCERVGERAHRVRFEVAQVVVIVEIEIVGSDTRYVDWTFVGSGDGRQKRQQQACDASTHVHPLPQGIRTPASIRARRPEMQTAGLRPAVLRCCLVACPDCVRVV